MNTVEPKHIEIVRNAAKDCLLFRDIDREELSALLACLDFRIRSYGRNDIVNMAGEPFEGIGVVIEGEVSVVRENAAGERIVFAILGRGDLFGEMAAFTGVSEWPATIIAHTDCTVMHVPAEKLVSQCCRSCTAHRKMIMNMLGILSRKALMLNRQLEYLSIKSIRGRIASFLLEQYKQCGKPIFMLAMNRNEMADFLNVTRPSLSREMCRMRDEGLIDFHRFSVRIRDMEALKAAAQGRH